MEIWLSFIKLLSYYVLAPSFWTVIFLGILIKFIPQQDKTTQIKLVSVTFLGYSLLYSLFLLISLLLDGEESEVFIFAHKATGPYWGMFVFNILCNCFFPLIFMFKKLQNRYWLVLITSFFIGLSDNFEVWVIRLTSLHRDYLRKDAQLFTYFLPTPLEIFRFIVGLLSANLLFFISKKTSTASKNSESLIDN